MIIVTDIDGVLTNGKHIYGKNGKMYKQFGSNDSDAMRILISEGYVDDIQFITSDKIGFEISHKRVADIGFELEFVKPEDRPGHIRDLTRTVDNVILIDDGLFAVDLAIESRNNPLESNLRVWCPQNAVPQLKNSAHKILPTNGGDNVFSYVLHYLQMEQS